LKAWWDTILKITALKVSTRGLCCYFLFLSEEMTYYATMSELNQGINDAISLATCHLPL
jgi:hypothetical protein